MTSSKRNTAVLQDVSDCPDLTVRHRDLSNGRMFYVYCQSRRTASHHTFERDLAELALLRVLEDMMGGN